MSTRPPLLPSPTPTAARGNSPLGRPTTTTTITTTTTKYRRSLYVCGSLHSSLHPATHMTTTIASSSHPQAPPATRPVQTQPHYHNQNGHRRCAVASFGQLLTARAEPLRNSCSCCRRSSCLCCCFSFCFDHVKLTRTGEVNKRAWAWGIGLGVRGVVGAALGE